MCCDVKLFLLLHCAVEGADDAYGSPAGEAVRQPGDLRGDGAGTVVLWAILVSTWVVFEINIKIQTTFQGIFLIFFY